MGGTTCDWLFLVIHQGFNDVDTEKCFGQFALCDFGELLTMLWSII
jgi:hypothetical protein